MKRVQQFKEQIGKCLVVWDNKEGEYKIFPNYQAAARFMRVDLIEVKRYANLSDGAEPVMLNSRFGVIPLQKSVSLRPHLFH